MMRSRVSREHLESLAFSNQAPVVIGGDVAELKLGRVTYWADLDPASATDPLAEGVAP